MNPHRSAEILGVLLFSREEMSLLGRSAAEITAVGNDICSSREEMLQLDRRAAEILALSNCYSLRLKLETASRLAAFIGSATLVSSPP